MDVALVPYAFSELFSYLVVIYGGYLAWRCVRAFERRTTEAARLDTLTAEVSRLGSALAQAEGRLDQTADAQRFATELLLDRGSAQRHDAADTSRTEQPRSRRLISHRDHRAE